MADSKQRNKKRYHLRRSRQQCVGCGDFSPVHSRCENCLARRRSKAVADTKVFKNSVVEEEVFVLEEPKKRDSTIWGCDCPFLYNCIKCDATYGENQIKDIGGYYLSCPKGHTVEISDQSALFPMLCPHDLLIA